MKRLAVLVALGILFVVLLLFGLTDNVISIADTGSPDGGLGSTVNQSGNSGSIWDLGMYIAIAALVSSFIFATLNYRHSESLFHRQEYPAVAWSMPQISRKGTNTVLTTSIVNKGPREITSVFLGAYLCKGFKKEAWCKGEWGEIPIGEPLEFVVTEELEQDVKERFGVISYNNGWKFDGNPRRFKAIVHIQYLPLISGVNPLVRKEYYLIAPIMENDRIKSWQLRRIPNWQGCLPWF